MSEAIIGAVVGAIVGGGVAWFISIKQINEAQKIARGQILLQFDERLDKYAEIHQALLPDGSWKHDKPKPMNIKLSDVITYMGLFERLYILMKNDLIDRDTAIRLYKYRLENIVRNDSIRVERLIVETEMGFWKDFFAICGQLGVEISNDGA